MPAPRTPTQIEAARRNGARSRGPVTEQGKARSSRNALKHGLAAAEHLLIEGEDRAAYDELLANLVAEIEPGTELEAQLVRRLAAALWKQGRADRLEAKLFAWTPMPKVIHGGRYQPVDAEAAFDLARFAAVQRYQAQLGREVSRILRDLRLSRKESLAAVSAARNEPEPAGKARQAAARAPNPPPVVMARLDPAIQHPRTAANDEGTAADLTCGSAYRTPPPSPPP